MIIGAKLKYVFVTLGILFFSSVLSFSTALAAEPVRYVGGKWPSKLGNHRAVVRVDHAADAVLAHLPWRRRDAQPERKAIFVVDAATKKRLSNVIVVNATQASGDIVFQPITAPGEYYVYYLPSKLSSSHYTQGAYEPAKETADDAWRSRVGVFAESLKTDQSRKLPRAKLVAFEALDEHDKFTVMERTATTEELESLLTEHARAAYLLFPEDRKHPIRMKNYLPKRWIDIGPRDYFEGQACRGEFYVFQIGLFAARRAIEDVTIVAEELRAESTAGPPIPASAIRCFNVGGVDSGGRPFKKTVSVGKGKVGALWFGVQVPPDAKPGRYEGTIHVRPAGEPGSRVALRLEVDKEVLADAGDSEPWRHSRLRWLDSTIAQDDQTVAPFTPLAVEDKKISCLGRDMTLDSTGLPVSIRSYFAPEVTHLVSEGRQLLAAPVRFVAKISNKQSTPFSNGKFEMVKQSAGEVVWRSISSAGNLELHCEGRMEFDGHVTFHMQLTADHATQVDDLRLEIPLTRETTRYMMGMGRPGGLRPEEYEWRWDRKNHQDSVWLGDVNAGLRCRLFGENYRRPVINIHYHHMPLNLPPAWYNQGRGGCSIRQYEGNRVVLKATSGPRSVLPGEILHFNFTLLITPLKSLDTDGHWAHRHSHASRSPDRVVRAGANVINIHHGTDVNPYINYPFVRTDKLKRYVHKAHAKDLKVKIYYTTREQSNHTVELWALRSLGDEVLVAGPGGGHTWLQEHLDPPYVSGWHTPATRDAAFITTAMSRWNNYYLEGLDWLVRNVGIDGLYIDDVAYDRTVMKRVRKILDRARPGCLIDLHSWNHFNQRAGHACCLNLYMAHLPYFDRIWIGEERNYNTPPDYWLIEISGIPFGVMGDMLQGGGNPWRGMIYGMTGRVPYVRDLRPIWKVWDEFGMQGSQMIGYWVPHCPVKTDHQFVLATVYRKPNKVLISLASWAKEKVDCRLAIDFTALKLNPSKVRLRAPAISDFQPSATFTLEEPITVDPGRGWLLVLEEE